MVSFECDYVAGAHPEILKRLVETNLENLPGYEDDHYCESAKEKIRAACGREDADVELLVGGTQTNMTVISTMLKEYEGVIAPDSGHINVHEAGAIEHSGHKVISVPADDGKLKAEDLRGCLKAFWDNPTHPHMVFPGMVYISHPTEYGTLYTLDELREIAGICKEHDIYLYIDGARLGYGIMSSDTDVTLKDIAELADVFYSPQLFGSRLFLFHTIPRHADRTALINYFSTLVMSYNLNPSWVARNEYTREPSSTDHSPFSSC